MRSSVIASRDGAMKSPRAATGPLARRLVSTILVALLPLAEAAPEQGGQPPASDAGLSPSCIDRLFSERDPRTALIGLEDRAGKWKLATAVSRVDGAMTYYACLPAEPAPDSPPAAASAALFVVCGLDVDDKAFITVPDHRFRGSVAVTTRFGDDQAEECDWEASADRKALLAPGTASGFARKLREHDTLSLQLTLRGQGEARFGYDLRGASDSLDLLARACRWSRFGDYYRSARPCEPRTAQAAGR
jgi:hypothetical protein